LPPGQLRARRGVQEPAPRTRASPQELVEILDKLDRAAQIASGEPPERGNAERRHHDLAVGDLAGARTWPPFDDPLVISETSVQHDIVPVELGEHRDLTGPGLRVLGNDAAADLQYLVPRSQIEAGPHRLHSGPIRSARCPPSHTDLGGRLV